MGNLNLTLFICIFAPLLMMLAVFKGRSRTVLIFLLTGLFVCLFAGEVNGLLMSLSQLPSAEYSVSVAPVVEEIMKALPIVLFAYYFKPERQTVIECSLALGIGFAILENAYLFGSVAGYVNVLWALARGFGTGLMHGITTVAVGSAMTLISSKHHYVLVLINGVLSIAICYHAIYNSIVGSPYSAFGILLPLLTYVPINVAIYKYKKNKKSEEKNETNS